MEDLMSNESKGFLHNEPVSTLRDVYNYMCTVDDWVKYEVTVTFKRTGFDNIAQCRKTSMAIASAHIITTEPECFIMTHELHQKGWSHYHAIVAYPKDLDSSDCLKTKDKHIGIVTVYQLRQTEYIQYKKGPFGTVEIHWENNFEYIIKDQLINKNKLKDMNYLFMKISYDKYQLKKRDKNYQLKRLNKKILYLRGELAETQLDKRITAERIRNQVDGKIISFS